MKAGDKVLKGGYSVTSLRYEIEQAMGLKFPERNGEALVRFEESMEIPRAAEDLMRGFYRNPDRIRQAFQNLQHETGSMLDILLPRRSRLREWAEELPDQPREAEKYLKETSVQLLKTGQHLTQIEHEIFTELEENSLNDLFPVSLSAFAAISYREPSVRVFLRPLGRLAEILQLNPEILRQAVRVHYLFLLLLVTGLDLDGQKFARSGDEPAIQTIVSIYTLRFFQKQSAELIKCYEEWIKAWGGKNNRILPADQGAEKIRAAMIFWRRGSFLSWEECLQIINQLEFQGQSASS